MFEQCGTPAYIAPEILKNKGYEGFSVDIWSCGVVLYAMLSGTVPFKGNNLNELHDLIMKGKFNNINDISNDAKHLIKNLLEIEPKKRISIQNILNHPWLVNVDVVNCKNYNLFTKAERILLAKSNVDYRDINNKDSIIENFDLKNLDTYEEIENKNINTKSIILAPFNSSISENNKNNNSLNYSKKMKMIIIIKI
jgi:serine/threonine protein kinase